MTDREAMQQALEALDWAADCIEPRKPINCDCPVCWASNALRERLAQPPGHDWQAEYIKQVELHNQTLDELRDALAQPETVMAEYKFQTYAAYKNNGEMKIGVVPDDAPQRTHWEGCEEVHPECKKTRQR